MEAQMEHWNCTGGLAVTKTHVKGFIEIEGQIVALWVYMHPSHVQTFLGNDVKRYRNETDGKEIKVGGHTLLSKIAEAKVGAFKETRMFLFANVRMLQNMFASKKETKEATGKENASLRAKEKIKKVLKGLPIPMDKEWEDLAIEYFSTELVKPANIYGDVPYQDAFIVDLDVSKPQVLETIESILVRSATIKEFEKYHKRVPKLKDLHYMVDPKRFNVKTWMQMLSQYGMGKSNEAVENFSKLHERVKRNIIYLYEVWGVDAANIAKALGEEDLKNASYKEGAEKMRLHNDQHPNKQLLLDVQKSRDPKIKELKGFLIKRILAEPHSKERSAEEFLDRVSKEMYSNVSPVATKLALKAKSLMLTDTTFQRYQEAYLEHLNQMLYSDRRYPTVSGKSGEYEWECMDFVNANAWFVGLETNCCQHLDGAGKSCLIYGAQNPETSGIFKISKKGKTIAQSWFWILDDKNEEGQITFDNIEVLGKEIRRSIIQCYLDFVEEIKKRRYFGIRKATVGLGFSDIDLTQDFPLVDNPIYPENVYTDAKKQVLLARW